jgi:mevalonate kinase
MKPATARANAKVILLGEHSVVYGEPALASAIGRTLEVRVRCEPSRNDGADPRFAEAVARAAAAFGIAREGVSVEVRSEIPTAAGLGSSAALSVALVRAFAECAGAGPLSPAEIVSRAAEIENVFHGTASGVDVAAAAYGGTILFRRGEAEPKPLRLPAPVELVVGLSGEPRSTGGPVGKLRERVAERPQHYRALFAAAGEIVRRGAEAVAAGDWPRLGSLFDDAQELLEAFGVSTPTLERMIRCARASGALGAKLTGAGGGGAIVALAPGRSAAVAEALSAEGFEAFVTQIS